MIKEVNLTDKPCESCGLVEAVEIKDETGDTINLCAYCAIKQTSKILKEEDEEERKCVFCEGKTKLIKVFQRSRNEVVIGCLPCINKINTESTKW